MTECDTLDSESWIGRWHTVARFSEADVDALPAITFVKSDGTVAETANGRGNWVFRISANRKSLEFRMVHGTRMVIR